MTLLLVSAGLFAAFIAISSTEKNINIIKAALKSLSAYILAYLFSFIALYATNTFSISKACLLTAIIGIAAAGIMLLRGYRPSWDFDCRNYIVPILISAMVIPFVAFVPFEFFGMGQDEGVYETEAIFYLRGYTSSTIDYPELSASISSDDKYVVMDSIVNSGVLGVYHSEYNPENPSSFYGIFHGLHSTSALLALWGSFWGIPHMAGINTLILILCIFWLWEILTVLKLKLIPKSAALAVFAFSPIVIWVSKSALAEPGLILLWLTFTYYLLGGRKSDRYIAGIIAGAYGFWHISAYVFMPLYIFLFIALYLYTADKNYIRGLIVTCVMYLAAFYYEVTFAPEYAFYNFQKLYNSVITRDNVGVAVTVAVAAVIVICIILLAVKHIYIKFSGKVIGIAVKVLYVICFVKIALHIIEHNTPVRNIPKFTFFSFFALTGFAVMLVAFISTFIFTKRWTVSRESLIILSVFMYCIPVYSTFFKMVTRYYYYYGRYSAMYIPFIAIAFAYAVNSLSGKKSLLTVLAGAVSLGFVLPHDMYLKTLKDDSRVEWCTLESIEEAVISYQADAVFLAPEIYYIAYYDLHTLGVDIYPITENFDSIAAGIASNYDTVFVIDDGSHSDVTEDLSIRARIINTGREDNGKGDDFLGFPGQCDVYLYPIVGIYEY